MACQNLSMLLHSTDGSDVEPILSSVFIHRFYHRNLNGTSSDLSTDVKQILSSDLPSRLGHPNKFDDTRCSGRSDDKTIISMIASVFHLLNQNRSLAL